MTVTSSIEPGAAPRHACINASCACNDLVSAGPCSSWCGANTVELSDLERGKDTASACSCGHGSCAHGDGIRGTPERGMS